MGFQPIQLGQVDYLGAFQALRRNMDATKERDHRSQTEALEKQRFDADKKRQSQFDFQQAYQTAANLAEKGDIAGAQALLAPYGASLQDLDAESAGLKKELGIGGGPKQPLTSSFYAGQPQGGSAVPDGMDGGRSMPAVFQQPGDTESPGAPPVMQPMGQPHDVEAGPASMPQMLGAPQGGPGIDQLMQQALPGGNPVNDPRLNLALSGFQRQQEEGKRLARRTLSFMSPTGQRIEMDMDAPRNFQLQQQDQERERNVALAENAFAETQDPKVMFQNLLRSGLNPKQASDMVGDMVEKRQQAEAAAKAKAEGRDDAKAEFDRQEAIRQKNRLAAQSHAAGLGLGAQRDRQEAADKFRIAPDTTIYGDGGKPIANVKDEKVAHEVNKSNANYSNLMNVLGKLEQSYAENGRVSPIGKAASEREALISQGSILYKNLAELGAIAGPDAALIEGALGKGGAIYVADPTPAIRKAREVLTDSQRSFMDTRGLPGAQVLPQLGGAGASKKRSTPDEIIDDVMRTR